MDRLLEKCGIAPGDSEILKRAFILALDRLHLVDRNDPICEMVARKVVEVGLDGSRNPQEIAVRTIKQFEF